MRKLAVAQPFLFAFYPLLALFASDIVVVRPAELALPAAVLACATGMLLLLATRLLGDRDSAVVLVSAFWLLLFSFEPLLHPLYLDVAGLYWFLVPAWILALVVVVVAVSRRRGRLQALADTLSLIVVVLLLMPAGSIVVSLIRRNADLQRVGAPPRLASASAAPGSGERAGAPSIFYIVLDGYARADVLEREYRYDNSHFLDRLTERGFFVASGADANYGQTYLSLASSLNACYLDSVAGRMGVESADRAPMQEMVARNAVSDFMRQRGYTYVTVGTGYLDRELRYADEYVVLPGSPDEFQTALLGMLPVLPRTDLPYEMHRMRLKYAFNHLADLASSPSPVFVFAHILAPHPPFVFQADGGKTGLSQAFSISNMRLWRDRKGYAGQLAFTNTLLETAIDAIIANSPQPPIIILQSDHGPAARYKVEAPDEAGLRERFPILNAYYLPGGGSKKLYDTITPVNTFRVILDEYFGMDYPLLEDKSYFSGYSTPYQLREVPRY